MDSTIPTTVTPASVHSEPATERKVGVDPALSQKETGKSVPHHDSVPSQQAGILQLLTAHHLTNSTAFSSS